MKSFDISGSKISSSENEMRFFLLSEIKKVIEGWNKEDIYAVSLFVYDKSDDPSMPTVTLGYNTEENFEHQLEHTWDEAEARWNYAFWLQNSEYVFGVNETRPLVERWIASKGFRYYADAETVSPDDEPAFEADEEITAAFVKELIAIVKELHESGFIQSQFGKDVPVLIHELEYYDQIAKQNIEANPPHVIEEFVDFCIG